MQRIALVTAVVLLALAAEPASAKPKSGCPGNTKPAGVFSGKQYCCPKGTRFKVVEGTPYYIDPKASAKGYRCPEGQLSIDMGNGTCMVWH